jgi:hypothetical protein
MQRNVTLATIVMAISLSAAASAQPNVLVNGDFETNPPPNLGNNVKYSISPWVLGPGDSSNVVTVDGPGGFDYGDDGPESDASAPGAGVKQHYLDIVGSNNFYQTFTPRCSGEVTFGGYFSTRSNQSGLAGVTLREGVGTSGPIVGQTNNVNVPGGHSRTDPWMLASFTAQMKAGTQYSFIVNMDNALNFDNGFVRYQEECTPPDPCCPPWNSALLEDLLFYKGSGGIAAPYTLLFQPTKLFEDQIQAYIDYLHALDSSMTTITINFRINDAGVGTAPSGGPQVGNQYFIGWKAGGKGTPVGSTNFFNLGTDSLKVNRWYRIHTGIFLNDGLKFFPDSCADNNVDVRIQVQRAASRGLSGSPVLQIRRADGSIVEKPLSSAD